MKYVVYVYVCIADYYFQKSKYKLMKNLHLTCISFVIENQWRAILYRFWSVYFLNPNTSFKSTHDPYYVAAQHVAIDGMGGYSSCVGILSSINYISIYCDVW